MKFKDLRREPIYKTPFTPAYWKDAASQLFDVRILCAAAILIAMRVALKSVWIPVGPELNITIGFFVNALGASIFGPVVAVIAAAISDTLGCILFPSGPYFFPFIFVEIAGSLIFALFLWRAKLSATRIILSRFAVVAVCNFILNPSIMIWYYAWLNNGGTYAFITMPRVIKNLALFPAEALLLVIFLGALIPVLINLRLIPKAQSGDTVIAKKHVILLVILFVIAVIIVLGYYFMFLPTQPQSESVTVGDLKVTIKSDRGTYDADDITADTPIKLTATLKNSGKEDITTWEDGEQILLVKLIPLNLGETAAEPVSELTVKGEMTVVNAGGSVSVTGEFYWTPEQLDSIYRGDYHAAVQAVVTVDGEERLIAEAIELKIK
ncbi:MAG: folate family ECF transporter S component [Clostridia bacterium]|nr:folate family ECF transporter S component [Clostridia bacterium]